MDKETIIIVNEKDEIIGHKERGTLSQSDIYRVSALWVMNSRDEILLAKRHHTKDHYPGRWGPAVTGTISEGETYGENIVKESKEEIGIKNVKFEVGPKTKISNEYSHFTQWYFLKIDKNVDAFELQKNEVEEVKWFSPEDLRKQFQKYPENFIPRIENYFKLFCKDNV